MRIAHGFAITSKLSFRILFGLCTTLKHIDAHSQVGLLTYPESFRRESLCNSMKGKRASEKSDWKRREKTSKSIIEFKYWLVQCLYLNLMYSLFSPLLTFGANTKAASVVLFKRASLLMEWEIRCCFESLFVLLLIIQLSKDEEQSCVEKVHLNILTLVLITSCRAKATSNSNALHGRASRYKLNNRKWRCNLLLDHFNNCYFSI